MMNEIQNLNPQCIWKNFYALTQVPRPSGHLEKVQQFLLDFGKQAGVEAFKDPAGNIVFRKPATPGMENRKGIILAVIAGVVMSFFSALVYNGVDLDNFAAPAAGKVTPYTAMVVFSCGVFLSNIIVNTIVMRKPFVGEPVTYKQYFSGSMGTHLVGVLGGAIWGLGTALNYISAGTAGAAVSYALGQGAPMIAAIWGVFVWKEFKGASKSVYWLLGVMFLLFVAGLASIVIAGM